MTSTGNPADRHDAKEAHAMTTTDYQAMLDEFERQSVCAWVNLVSQSRAKGAARFEPVQTGAGIGLIVNTISYARSATVEEVLAGTADVASMVATQDGGRFENAWHEGESDIDTWVYYERYEDGARIAHGFLDPTSRRLVQAG